MRGSGDPALSWVWDTASCLLVSDHYCRMNVVEVETAGYELPTNTAVHSFAVCLRLLEISSYKVKGARSRTRRRCRRRALGRTGNLFPKLHTHAFTTAPSKEELLIHRPDSDLICHPRESDGFLLRLPTQQISDFAAYLLVVNKVLHLKAKSARIRRRVILLDTHDQTELEQWLGRGHALVKTCPNHDKERYQCWQPIREYLWNLQKTKPGAPITRAAELLWDAIEEFARTFTRPSKTDSRLEALSVMVADLAAKNDGLPEWLGKRRTK
jgi:hypothetical protein